MQAEIIEGFRLSPQQRHVWLLHKLEHSAPYRVQCAVLIEGPIDKRVLELAIGDVVARHEILRTAFRSLPGVTLPLQIITEQNSRVVCDYDLRGLENAEQQAQLESIYEQRRQLPLDYASGSLLDSCLISFGEEEHVIVLSLSTLCADAATMRNLVREISSCYGSRLDQVELPNEHMQYADLAEWQNDLLEADGTEAGRNYWADKKLSNLSDGKLPGENDLDQSESFAPKFISLVVDRELLDRVEALTGKYEIGIDAFLLACWQALLWRLTEQPVITVGAAYDGRVAEELRDASGPLSKYLPMQCELGAELHFVELLEKVSTAMDEASEWQELFEWEQIPDSSPNDAEPSFPFCFDYENCPEPIEAGGLSFSLLKQYACIDKYKVKLSCFNRKTSLDLEFHYDSRLYKPDQIERLKEEFHAVLSSVVVNPESAIIDADFLGREELRQVLHGFNDTSRAYANEKCIHELIEARAQRHPKKIAVTHEGRGLTYKELHDRTNQLANYLRKLGVGPEVPVGICAERSLEMVIGLMAILKAGGAYLPLDPTYPAERLAFMLEDTQAPVLLTLEHLLPILPEHNAQVVCLDTQCEAIERESDAYPVSGVTPDNLAYIIYTSGSTGKPKGVLVSHRNLVHSTTARNFYYSEPVTKFLLLSSFAFDSSIAGIFWTLCDGGAISLPRENFQQDLEQLTEQIAQERVSHLLCLPSLHALILAEPQPGRLASLRAAIVAGEPCPVPLVTQHEVLLPDTSLFNEYGPTEATVWSSVYDCGSLSPHAPQVPIGGPIPNIQIYILDRRLKPVPVGVSGEVFVGGEGITRGYLNRPELTAEKFIPNPFAGTGTRLYRTGDVARWLSDGNIEFLGRVDHQVKIRGYRIELGEIETVLRQHSAVKECVVAAREDEPGNKRLVAYLVTNAQPGPTVTELRAFIKDRLPDYMVPAVFVTLDALPLMPNGKVDHAGLPASETVRPKLDRIFVAPATPLEQKLAEIWGEVLKVEKVGVHDNFFELGGDSIRSVQVRAKAQAAGIHLDVQQLFKYQTIGALAEALVDQDPNGQPEASTRSLPFDMLSPEDRLKIGENIEDAYPLARLQLGMLFHSEFSREASAYHDVSSLHLKATLDLERMRQALATLITRHPLLRTSFDLSNFSEPLQLVHSVVETPFSFEDLRHLSATEQEVVIRDWIQLEKSRHLDWSNAPLIRFHVHLRGDSLFQFSVSLHHAVLDGWSSASMLTELFQEYFHSLGEEVPPLAPPPTSTYRDFIALERAALESEEAANFWTQRLSDSRVTRLPRWPAVSRSADEGRAHSRAIRISPEVSDDLKNMAQRAGVPLKNVLLAAHLKVLGQLSGQSDVVTGLVSHGRPEEIDGDRVLGLFLNTLPFRLNLSGGTWLDLVRETFDEESNLITFRRYPLAELQRGNGEQQLFEVAFNFIHFHVYQSIDQFKHVEVMGAEFIEETNFALMTHFILDSTDSPVQLRLDYDGRELCGRQVEAIAGYYVETLEAMARAPEERHERHSILSAEERHELLVTWNATGSGYLDDRCLHQLFEDQVERTPDNVAVVYEREQLSYRELNDRANQLAHYLRRKGVRPDVLVGIYLHRSIEMLVSVLAVLKAGGAYVPLDPLYPAERISFILDDAQIDVLLTNKELLPTLSDTRQAVCLDEQRAEISRFSEENPTNITGSRNLAYTIYTSGSTGKPKGVQVEHRGVVSLLSSLVEVFAIGTQDVVLSVTSLSFDIAEVDLHMPLLRGASVVIANRHEVVDWQLLSERIAEVGATFMQATPATWRLLIEGGWKPVPARLKILSGGEALSPKLTRELKERSVALWNGYGPTETTIYSTAQKIETVDDTIPIGRPVSNTQVYVLDARMDLAPVGVPGELYIGGIGVGRGYLSRPDLTAERFVPNPFSKIPGERLYRTGDLVRYQPQGILDYLGRVDHQVKIRGYRIELGEIENVLNQHPAVKTSVAVAVEDATADKRLIGYVVPKPNGLLTAEELRSHLMAKLPEYMVPSAFVLLDELPLTPNGKVDRRALPAPREVDTDSTALYVPPRTHIEELLAQIWAGVLNRKQVSIYDSFFDLGGHSLLIIRLVSRIRDAFKIEMQMRDLFDAPTVAQLAEIIEAKVNTGQQLALVPMSPVSKDRPLPLSFSQQRLWFLANLSPDSSAYNIPAVFRLTGHLDVDALEQSFNEVVKRHEILRTRFEMEDEQSVQIIVPEVPLNIEVRDLGGSTSKEREPAAIRMAIEEGQRPFDLSQPPLLRVMLLRLAEEEHIAVLTMHHIVSDGWSMGVFIRELAALYEAYTQGNNSPLEELPIQYADYAVWQREQLRGERLEQELDYWREQLRGAPAVLELPTDRPRPAVQSHRGGRRQFTMNEELSGQIRELARSEGVTQFMLLAAAFNVLLHRYSGQEDILIGAPVAGRERAELEDLIGFFVNTLVLRTRVARSATFRELLAQVRETVLGAFMHQSLPFEKLVDELQPQRSLNHSPLFQVMFTFQNASTEPIGLSGLTLTPMEDTGTAKFDLTLLMHDAGEGFGGTLEYNTDLFDTQTVTMMMENFKVLLNALTLKPHEAISTLPLMTESERALLLCINETGERFAPEGCIHQLFEAQVERTPDNVALTSEELSFTYRELNQRANMVANHLIAAGVTPDTPVGICVERSADMVVGLLGILKAGGAYVPLDPAYPKERLAFVVEDTAMPLLVTQEHLRGHFDDCRTDLLCLDSDWELISKQSNANPVVEVMPEHLAYVIYTSGSTGKSKGVLITHYEVTRLFAATQRWFNFSPDDVWTLFHSYAFDFSVWELWGALIYGGRLVVVPYWVSRSPESFYRLLVSEQVTVLNQTPSAFRQLIQAEQNAGTSPELALRFIIFGGEALELQSLKPWFDRHGDEKPQLVNMYGITETTVHVTYRPLTKADLRSASGCVIGAPIVDLQIFILDESLQPVPFGVPGEICVGGDGLARGYLNRPELTAERFIPNPFNSGTSARLYRSGDLGRVLNNGDIEYLGRMDHQVKIRGFRIELGEIEATLSQHPGVRESVVIVRTDSPGDKRLVAYLVIDKHLALSTSELRGYLKERLPEYMLPAAFVMVDAIPLTSNGKVDRQALPGPTSTSLDAEQYMAPRNEIENLLTEIWQEVLGVDPIGIHDDYFALGGDSMRVVQIVHRAGAYNLPMTVKDVFQAPTIYKLAGRVADNRNGRGSGSIPLDLIELPPHVRASLPDDIEDQYPASKMQELMLFHYEHDKQGMGVYHAQHWFDIQDDELSLQALEKSLRMLVQKHPVLRTVFLRENGRLVQAVKKQMDFSIAEVDIRNLNETQQDEYVDAAVRKDRITLFDAHNTDAHLFRVQVFKRSENRIVFLMSRHHALDDGWGNVEFLKELFTLYQGIKAGEENAKTVATNSFKEFIAMEQEILASNEAKSFWQDHLKRANHRPLHEIAISNEPLAHDPIVLDNELTKAVRRLARSQKVSLKAVYLSAYLDLVAEAQGTDTATIGVVSNGRSERLSEPFKSLGLFWNMLPLCAPIDSQNKLDQIRTVQQLLIDVEPYAKYPLPQILEDQGKPELFFATLNFLHFHNARNSFDNSIMKQFGAGSYDKFHFPLNYVVALDPNSGQVLLRVEYDKSYFSARTVEAMTNDYIARLKSMAFGQLENTPKDVAYFQPELHNQMEAPQV
jgi:amino acid adenylation domain-containing protein